MTQYRLVLTIEEENGDESSGEEITDFTHTLAYANDLTALAEFSGLVKAAADLLPNVEGVTADDPDYDPRPCAHGQTLVTCAHCDGIPGWCEDKE